MSLERELSEAMREHVADVRASSLTGAEIRRRHRGRRARLRTAGAALVTVAVAGTVPSYLAPADGPRVTVAGPGEGAATPRDLGGPGDGRTLGGVRFGYLPGDVERVRGAGGEPSGEKVHTMSWHRPGLPKRQYDLQAVVYRDEAVAGVTKRMRGYDRQGAEPIRIDGHTAYLVRAGENSRIEENGIPTLLWTENRDVAVEIMMSPDYAGILGDGAGAELGRIAEAVEPIG